MLFSNVINSSQTPAWVFHTNMKTKCVTAFQWSETKSNIDRKRTAVTGSYFMCFPKQIYCLGSGFVKRSHSARHGKLLIQTSLIDWNIRPSWAFLCTMRLSQNQNAAWQWNVMLHQDHVHTTPVHSIDTSFSLLSQHPLLLGSACSWSQAQPLE